MSSPTPVYKVKVLLHEGLQPVRPKVAVQAIFGGSRLVFFPFLFLQ